MDDRAELFGEVRRFDRDLPVVLMDVEVAALRAGICRGLGLIDRGGDAVYVQDASQGQATEAGADDRDRCRHSPPRNWNVIPARLVHRSSCVKLVPMVSR